jgi:hypothetical protein
MTNSLEAFFCNVDDRKPVPELLKSLFGKVFGDRGYVSQPLAIQLFENYRSPINAMINVICGLIAYCHQPKKPSLHME